MLRVSSYKETHERLIETFYDLGKKEIEVEITNALGKVLSEDQYSPEDLPPFSRSTMDGYAVRAKDTFGASASLPAILDIVGKVDMGEYVDYGIEVGQVVSIPTGGMLPENADSVVMIEYTETLDDLAVLIERPVSPHENVIEKGEDIRKGELLFAQGHVLRPQDIGVLASAGITNVKVYDALKVGIISTGNEIVDPNDDIGPGKIRDINSYSLSAAMTSSGMVSTSYGIVNDQFDALRGSLVNALEENHVVLISGGSSVGIMDMTYKVIDSLEDSEMLIHGIAVKPGKPTIIARVGEKAVIGLPGHPVSAFIIYHTVVDRFLKHITGLQEHYDSGVVQAVFSDNYATTPGREEFVMVSLSREDDNIIASPVYGKSGMMATMAKADGYIHIAASREGIYKDEKVQVHLF